jgi:CRP-like cAMP-binding protein
MNFDRDQMLLSAFGPGTSLSELDTSSLDAIKKVAIRKNYEKGQIICLEGEPCPGLIIIESGWLKGMRISSQGREQETRLAGPGEMLNEVSVMVGGDNLITLKSLEASVLWVVERETWFDLMAKHPHLSNTISQNLAKQVVNLLNLVEDLALRPVDARLAHLLLNRSTGDIVYRQSWATEAEMAASIGTTSELISRVLNEMEGHGLIRLEHHRIYILNRKMLEEIAFQKSK